MIIQCVIIAEILIVFCIVCYRIKNGTRVRGRDSKKKQKCWKVCSTQILCDSTTPGSTCPLEAGRSLSWLLSSWLLAPLKRKNCQSLSLFMAWLWFYLNPINSVWCLSQGFYKCRKKIYWLANDFRALNESLTTVMYI